MPTRTATPNRKSTTNAPSSTRKAKGIVDRTSGRSSPVVSMRSPSNKALTVTRRPLWLDNCSINGTREMFRAPNAARTHIGLIGPLTMVQLQQGFATGEMGFRGQLAPHQSRTAHVRFGSKADIRGPRHVRFTPKSGHAERDRHARGPPVIVSSQSVRRSLRGLQLAHQACRRQRRRLQGARCTKHTYQDWFDSS
jgi:hypothetical protein